MNIDIGEYTGFKQPPKSTKKRSLDKIRIEVLENQVAKLQAENESLKDDVKQFNRGWTDRQNNKPFDTDENDIWQHGWQIFNYNCLRAENEGLKGIIRLAVDGIDALNCMTDKTPTYEDFQAVKTTLEQELKGNNGKEEGK